MPFRLDVTTVWLVAVPLCVAVALWAGDEATSGPILCASRRLFGLPCPGCGLTRGFVALLHGHLDAGLEANALTPVVALVMAAGWLWSAAFRSGIAPRPTLGRPALAAMGLGLVAFEGARLFAFFSEPAPLERMCADSALVRATVEAARWWIEVLS